MAQPKLPPLSVRLPADLLVDVDAAARDGEARNAVIVRLLREALAAKAVQPPAKVSATVPAAKVRKAAPERREAARVSVAASVPLAGTFRRGPMQKTPKR